eukprot:354635-Chlamydomonas_euryale.AAC.5
MRRGRERDGHRGRVAAECGAVPRNEPTSDRPIDRHATATAARRSIAQRAHRAPPTPPTPTPTPLARTHARAPRCSGVQRNASRSCKFGIERARIEHPAAAVIRRRQQRWLPPPSSTS